MHLREANQCRPGLLKSRKYPCQKPKRSGFVLFERSLPGSFDPVKAFRRVQITSFFQHPVESEQVRFKIIVDNFLRPNLWVLHRSG